MFLLFWEMKLSSLKLKKAYKPHAWLKITKPSETGGKMRRIYKVYTKTSLQESIFEALFKERL